MRNNRLLNHHKLKKKVGRNVSKWTKIFSLRKKTRRDYSWKGKHDNPFQQNHKDQAKKRLKIQIIIIVISILGSIALALYHPFFSVHDITISGLQRIEQDDIRDTIGGFCSYKAWGFLPQRSYFIADIEEIKNILKERYPIERIVIEKRFPNNLSIVIEEKISTVIYDNSELYSYIDLDGNVVEIMRKVSDYEWNEITETVTSTNEMGEEIQKTNILERNHKPDVRSITAELGSYPIVYDMRHKPVVAQQQTLDPVEVKAIVAWYNRLTKTTDIPLKYIVIENDIGDITIETFERWYIKSRITRDVDTQVGELEYLFREKIDREQLNYIDLRYADRVYWQ